MGYSTQQKIIEVAVLRGRASEQKMKLEEREQKMHVKKRPLNPSCCCSCSQLRQQRQQQQSSAYFMAFFAMAVGAFGRLGQPTELLSDLPCRAWMRFYVWPSELFATATEHIYFLNFELNWNCINVLDKRCYHQIICECLERGKSFQNILQ